MVASVATLLFSLPALGALALFMGRLCESASCRGSKCVASILRSVDLCPLASTVTRL